METQNFYCVAGTVEPLSYEALRRIGFQGYKKRTDYFVCLHIQSYCYLYIHLLTCQLLEHFT